MNFLLSIFKENTPLSATELYKSTVLNKKGVWDGLYYLWRDGFLLRTEKPLFNNNKVSKGRAGVSINTRVYYLYLLKPKGKQFALIQGKKFVAYKAEHLDVRGNRENSKAQQIIDFLKRNSDKAYYSIDIVKHLSKGGIVVRDIMSTVRRYAHCVYVRGYRTDEGQTPFKEGFILTWIDQDKPREQALEEAIERTNKVLENRNSTSPLIERIHRIRDIVIESTKLKDLTSHQYLKQQLKCTETELHVATLRSLQLYSDLKEVKLFNNFCYYYHNSMSKADLHAAVEMKQNYIRIVKGKDNRIGHNWEAVPEWFIDKFTTGARFWTQNHRTEKFDSRRITIHLIRPVGGRKNNAEVDRVWEVTPSLFAKPITFVLECKWGLFEKRYIDDFFEVLRWSKEFGVDGSEGRQVKHGVLGVLAGSAFDPRENVRLKDDNVISLAAYASRLNIQLLKASDFNEKLRERGVCKEVTVQSICRAAKDEREVRELLQAIWANPKKANELLTKAVSKNKEVYEFEKALMFAS